MEICTSLELPVTEETYETVKKCPVIPACHYFFLPYNMLQKRKRCSHIQTSTLFPYAIKNKCQVILSILACSINIKGDATHCTLQIDSTLMNARLSDWSVLPHTFIQSEITLDSFKIAFNVFLSRDTLINSQWNIESALQHVKAKHEGCQKISIKPAPCTVFLKCFKWHTLLSDINQGWCSLRAECACQKNLPRLLGTEITVTRSRTQNEAPEFKISEAPLATLPSALPTFNPKLNHTARSKHKAGTYKLVTHKQQHLLLFFLAFSPLTLMLLKCTLTCFNHTVSAHKAFFPSSGP